MNSTLLLKQSARTAGKAALARGGLSLLRGGARKAVGKTGTKDRARADRADTGARRFARFTVRARPGAPAREQAMKRGAATTPALGGGSPASRPRRSLPVLLLLAGAAAGAAGAVLAQRFAQTGMRSGQDEPDRGPTDRPEPGSDGGRPSQSAQRPRV